MSEIIQSEESVRLYEYEPYKPDLEDYIAHHGVKDMHWGVRNGPPYPLSSKLSTGSRLKKGAKGAGGSYGGNPNKLKKKAAKASVKAAKANKKAAQAGNSLLHPFKAKKKDKLQTKAFKAQAQADKLNAKLNKEEIKDAAKKKTDEIKRQKNIDREVENARKTGMYDMEFLERNLDLDPVTEKQMTGKALDDAYRKFLDERGFPGVPGRETSNDTKYGGAMKELATRQAEDLMKKNKNLSFEEAMAKVTGEKKKSIGDKIHDYKVNKQRKASLEKARQTKAENTAKRQAEAQEKERISKMREEAIKKNDIVTMYKNADHFSNEEIETALSRKGVVDRLAEAAKSTQQPSKSAETPTPQTSTSAPAPKKEKYLKNMVKTKLVEGLKEAAESKTKQLAKEALKMTIEELALNAAGVKEDTSKLSDAQKLERRRKAVMRLIG